MTPNSLRLCGRLPLVPLVCAVLVLGGFGTTAPLAYAVDPSQPAAATFSSVPAPVDFGRVNLRQPFGWIPVSSKEVQFQMYPSLFTEANTPVQVSVLFEQKGGVGFTDLEELAKRKFKRIEEKIPGSSTTRLADLVTKDGARVVVYSLQKYNFGAMAGFVENGDAVAIFALNASDPAWFEKGQIVLKDMIASFEWKR